MSRKLAYDPPLITVHGDIRELTRAGVTRSVWTQLWMPGQEVDPEEPAGLS